MWRLLSVLSQWDPVRNCALILLRWLMLACCMWPSLIWRYVTPLEEGSRLICFICWVWAEAREECRRWGCSSGLGDGGQDESMPVSLADFTMAVRQFQSSVDSTEVLFDTSIKICKVNADRSSCSIRQDPCRPCPAYLQGLALLGASCSVLLPIHLRLSRSFA